MDVFSAAPHHNVLVLIVQVGVLLLAARAFGEIAQRLGQPSVVGELLAGIILGPSLLAGFFPFLSEWLVPQSPLQGYLLEVVSMIGAMFLMLITGLETDIKLIKRHARTAIGVSFGGILVTFSSGFVLGQFLPDFLVANADNRIDFELFVAVSMSISAIPVIAKVLMDMNLMRRDIGQTIIAAGMSDDTTGWILLSIVAGLASGQAVTIGSVLQIIGSVVAFMLVSFTLGRWAVKKMLRYVQDEVKMTDRLLTLVVVLMFFWGAITTALNLEAVLGAFVIGIIFGTMPRLPQETIHKLESIALGVFAPIFFGVAGLKVDIISLLEPQLLLITGIVIFIASAGKVIGTYAGARLIGGKDHWNALGFGAGLNARGAMEIIIATIGLRLEILSQEMYSIIVVMAMATSMMAPTALRWVLKHVKSDKEEDERLKKEGIQAESLVADIHRVLVPIRPRIKDIPGSASSARHTVEAQLLELLGRNNDISITLMTIASKKEKETCKDHLDEVAELFDKVEVETKVVEAKNPADAILDEAKKDYDLLVLGATEKNIQRSQLFNPVIDDLVRLAPCATAVVQAEQTCKDWHPDHILVPTNGSRAARNAAELGFYMAGSSSQEVLILNVVEEEKQMPYHYRDRGAENKTQMGTSIIEEYKKLGEALKVRTQTLLKKADSPEQGILSIAKQNNTDLIIVGTNVRPGTDRLYLGSRVENILENADCPVVVFNTY